MRGRITCCGAATRDLGRRCPGHAHAESGLEFVQVIAKVPLVGAGSWDVDVDAALGRPVGRVYLGCWATGDVSWFEDEALAAIGVGPAIWLARADTRVSLRLTASAGWNRPAAITAGGTVLARTD